MYEVFVYVALKLKTSAQFHQLLTTYNLKNEKSASKQEKC